jgi:hypothetical protein
MPVARWRTRNCAERPAAPPRRTIGGDYLSALASVKGKSKKALFNPAKYRHFELHIVK